MGKYWTEKQNNVDDILAEDFNSAFDNIAQDITNALTEATALSDKIDTVKSETEQKLSGKADKTYVDEAFKEINGNIAIREKSENKGMPNGYAPLDSAGNIPNNYLHVAIPHTTASGYPITLTDHLAGEKLLSCMLYGADGGVGDLQEDGRYKISVKAEGKNIYNPDEVLQPAKWSGSNCLITYPDGTYTISYDYDEYSSISSSVTVRDIDANTIAAVFANTTSNIGRNSVTFTSNKNWYLFVRVSGTPSYQQLYNLLTSVLKNIQIEHSNAATAYQEYIMTEATIYLDAPLTAEQSADVSELKTIDSDVNTITTETAVTPSKIEVEYYQDINKVITNLTNAILAQGGNA